MPLLYPGSIAIESISACTFATVVLGFRKQNRMSVSPFQVVGRTSAIPSSSF